MPASIKAFLHSFLTIVALVAPTVMASNASLFNMSLGAFIGLVLNFLLSYTIPTTTGKSAMQNLPQNTN